MTDATAEFFRELGCRGRKPSLAKTDRWLLTLDRGDVSVSHKKVAADCIMRTSGRDQR